MYPTVQLQDEGRYSNFEMQQAAASTQEPVGGSVPQVAVPYPAPVYDSRSSLHPRQQGQWTSGLCHCFDDPENCMITCFCPCLTFGQVTELINKGKKSCMSRGCLFTVMCLMGCACFYSCFYRSKLRAQLDLRDEPCNDCLVHFCCTPCALCQEYRELRNRGFDMAIGWEANMDRQKRGVSSSITVMAPPMGMGVVTGGMTR